MFVILALLLVLANQGGSVPPNRILNPTNPNPVPGDARMSQFDGEIPGTSWRVFSVRSFPDAPAIITQVEEVRQQNPPSTWAVYVGNRDYLPVNSLTIAAAVVDIKGKIKATQTLPVMRNVKPSQIYRKEIPIRVTIVSPTDRVVFYVKAVKSESGDWQTVDADIAELIRVTAQKLPVP
jgi:hypothetical protein